MSSVIGTILLRLALLLLPSLEAWIRGMLASPPPPTVPQELHNTVATMLPAMSSSQEAVDKLSKQ